MKITWKPIVMIQAPLLGNLKVGDTFMFIEYDETIGPFLVIDPKGYCQPKSPFQNPRVFVLNLAKNTIHYRTTTAIVRPVNCSITVG